jgi:uncharacterized protein YcbK (DUF882 family)
MYADPMPKPTSPRMAARLAFLAWAIPCAVLWSGVAAADVQHVVARGHTIEAIAHRYHVTVKAIVDANHLKDARHLKIGETLIIPGVSAPKPLTAHGTVAAPGKGAHPVTYAMRAKTPGVVHATRLATNEDFTIRVSSRRGHVAPAALKGFERMMRSTSGLTHPPDPRLIALVGQVANHFGSRKLEVISGFRPYSPTQYTAHSNHNIGHALDFRVVGVPNEVLRDYCKTLHNVGVGYYPNSTFVHLDVRDTNATWIDYSRAGEPPRYNTPGVDADEGTSDVSEGVVTPESAVPGGAPLAPLPPVTSPASAEAAVAPPAPAAAAPVPPPVAASASPPPAYVPPPTAPVAPSTPPSPPPGAPHP